MHYWSKITIYWFAVLGVTPNYCYSQTFTNKSSEFDLTEPVGDGIFGHGVSTFDFNKDGYPDLTLATDQGQEILVYKNLNGNSFERIPGVFDDSTFQKQVNWVDFDNDGDNDLFVTRYNYSNLMYINDGQFTFTKVNTSIGLIDEAAESYGATFGDLNGDHHLDLLVSNYSDPSRLYLNMGNGTFKDTTASIDPDFSNTLNFCSAFIDYDNDGDLDIYKINDKIFANELFRNDGNMIFTEVGSVTNTDIVISAMNAGVGDINNDGDFDFYVTNEPPNNVLLKNDTGTFSDITSSSGTGFGSTCWGGIFGDFENDGDQDLYVCSSVSHYNHPNKLFVNNGDETFTTLTNEAIAFEFVESFACAKTDFNNDGLLDIVISNNNNLNPSLWINQTSNSNNFISLELEGSNSNFYGIGARIEMFCGNESYYRFLHNSIAYLAQESHYLHVGLSDHSNIDSLVIKWPSGHQDYFLNLPTNQFYNFKEYSNDYCLYHINGLNDQIENGTYHSSNKLSSSGYITTNQQVNFLAQQSILLAENFSVDLGAQLLAKIAPCHQ